MSKDTNARLHKVGQRGVKITFRATKELAATKPPHLSWGDFVERLVRLNRKDGLYHEELVRYCAWCAVALDRICCEIPERFPRDPSSTLGERVDRLAAVFKLIEEIAALRNRLEEQIHANH